MLFFNGVPMYKGNRVNGVNIVSQSILITGASSGIGEALAFAYAKSDVSLHLVGRNASRLEHVAQKCKSLGATVHYTCVDVSDRLGMQAAITKADNKRNLDLIIANAGVAKSREDPEFSRTIIETNIVGILNTVEPAIDLMTKRNSGQIAIVSSMAAFRALGGPPGYAGSKAWARLYAEALRGRLARKGVAVNVICPGFVITPMTQQAGKAGMLSGQAALIIKEGLSKNEGRISFPKRMAFQTWWLSMQPTWWSDRKIFKTWKSSTKTKY